jgi:thiol-disulfide isomerase/thioredoxin
MKFLKKHYGNIFFIVLLALLLIPQIRMPVQVYIQKLFSSAPKKIDANKRATLSSYAWTLKALNGPVVDFSLSKNRVTVVNHWATWCPPCVAEMPSMQKLFDAFKTKADFYFVTNDELSSVNSFLVKNGYTIPVFFEVSAAPSLLQTTMLPTTFIIGKDGKIAMQVPGAADWNSPKVHELLEVLLAE